MSVNKPLHNKHYYTLQDLHWNINESKPKDLQNSMFYLGISK